MLPDMAGSGALPDAPESSSVFARLLVQADETRSTLLKFTTDGGDLPQTEETGKDLPLLPAASYERTDNNARVGDMSSGYVDTPLVSRVRSATYSGEDDTKTPPMTAGRRHLPSDSPSVAGDIHPFESASLTQQQQQQQQQTQLLQTIHLTAEQPKQLEENLSPTPQQGIPDEARLRHAAAQGQIPGVESGTIAGDIEKNPMVRGSLQAADSTPVVPSPSLPPSSAHSEGARTAEPVQSMQRETSAQLIALRNALSDFPSHALSDSLRSPRLSYLLNTGAPAATTGAGNGESTLPSLIPGGNTAEHRLSVIPTPQDGFMTTVGAAVSGAIIGGRDKRSEALILKSPDAVSLIAALPDSPGVDSRSPLNPEVAGAGLDTLRASEAGRPIGPDRFSTQLAERIQVMHTRHLSSASIRLDPADLGRIDVQIRVHQDVAHINFHVQNSGVRDFMEQQMPRLRMAIEDSGLMLGDVDVGSGQQQQQPVPEENRRDASQLLTDTPPIQERPFSRSDWRLVDAYA